MLDRWARVIHRHRRLVLGLSMLLLVASVALLSIGSDFHGDNTIDAESARASDLLHRELPSGEATTTLIASSSTLTVDQSQFRVALDQALAPLANDHLVLDTTTPYKSDGSLDSSRVSADKHHALITIGTINSGRVVYEEIRPRITSPVLDLVATGNGAIQSDYDRGTKNDAATGEKLSLPLSVLLLLMVFGGVVAALLPLGTAVVAVLSGLAVVAVLTHLMNVDGAAQNVVIFLGLGLGIDYSLFIVARFREELGHGRDIPDALAITLSTAGRAIAVSGMTVAISLLGLLFFKGTFLAPFGLAVCGVVLLAVAYALSFLPALLAMLGPRVDRLRIRRVRTSEPGQGRWHRLAMGVMQHPVAVLVTSVAVLLVAFIPFTQIRFGTDHLVVLPSSFESRRGAELLAQQFPSTAQTHIDVVVHYTDGQPPLTPEHVGTLWDLSRQLERQPGVLRVIDIVPADRGLSRVQFQQLYAMPVAQLPAEPRTAVSTTVGTDLVFIRVDAASTELSDASRAVVSAIRSVPPPPGSQLLVTGQTAFDVDFVDYINQRIPFAIGFVLVATYLVLLMLFHSVVLPLKAVLMNLLSISTSFGAMVFVFQQGHFSGLLDFSPAPIDPGVPIILFCVLFGLSMDYEVFMLTRIQEEWMRDHDTRRAIAAGLERSAPLVTGAALIMIVVVASFGLGQLTTLKIIGLGGALAILVDATIVRALIVPAAMRLMGDANWWTPRWLAPFLARVPRPDTERA
jgi:RND superfamily putative drug exporter